MKLWFHLCMALTLATLGSCDDLAPERTIPLDADAGDDVVAMPGEAVRLRARATGGQRPYKYRWNVETRPEDADETLPDANTNNVLEVEPLRVGGRYVFRVRVTDALGKTDSSFVTVRAVVVTSSHVLRVINETAQLGVSVDADTAGIENITAQWEILRGEAELSDANTVGPEATILAPETVQLRATVTADIDGERRTGVDDVFIVGVDDARPRVVIANGGAVSGDIVLELFTEEAPNTCANFLRYVDDRFYDGLLWHRVIEEFIIQGGAFERKNGELVERSRVRPPIRSEAGNGKSNVRGMVGMALRGDDADSADVQFFVNLGSNGSLDEGPPPVTVFATVVEGMNLVNDIAAMPINASTDGMPDVPATDIVMSSVRRRPQEAPTPAPQTIEISAESSAPLRVVGESAVLSVTFDEAEVPGDPIFAWVVVDGEAEISDAASASPSVTITDRGTVLLQVTLTAQDEKKAVEGTADVFIVGVSSATPEVVIKTGAALAQPFGIRGQIVLQLLTEAAPNTCANFLRYVDEEYYDGLFWHLIEQGLFIQTGAFERQGDQLVEREGTRPPIASEAGNGESNVRGSVAMALQGTDADSAVTQFFINLDDNSALDEGDPPFTVFARVSEGMDLVDQIAAVEVQSEGGMPNVPVEDLILESVRRRGEAQEIEISATAGAPLRIVGESTSLSVTFIEEDLPGDPVFTWEVIAGQADVSDPASPTPDVTILSSDTVQLRVTLTAESDEERVVGTADVFVVGVPDALPQVVIQNDGAVAGEIVIELLTAEAPNTCANFLRYVDDGFYDGIVWHRVVRDFVIQAGAFERVGGELVKREGVRPTIDSEADVTRKNVRGTIAMALLGTDADSATNQFFINLLDNPNLDTGTPPFTVFARVIEGMANVADQIAVVEVGSDSGMEDVPTADITMVSVRRRD